MRTASDPNDCGMSQREVARALGLSPQRVAQIEAEALRKCREIARQLGFNGGDFFDELNKWRRG